MKRKNFTLQLIVFLFFSFHFLQAQEYTISGYVRDIENGETLIGSFVYLTENGASTVTNEYGFYSITVEGGTYTLNGTYLGYKDNIQSIVLDQNRTINIEMAPDANTLDEVVVTAEEVDRNVRSLEMSVNKLDIKTLEKLPTLLGETEILRGNSAFTWGSHLLEKELPDLMSEEEVLIKTWSCSTKLQFTIRLIYLAFSQSSIRMPSRM